MSELKQQQLDSEFANHFNRQAAKAYENAKDKGFRDKAVHISTRLALIHSEVSEALEAVREGDLAGFSEELADIAIRLMDLAFGENVDLGWAIVRKMRKNADRPRMHGGKLF